MSRHALYAALSASALVLTTAGCSSSASSASSSAAKGVIPVVASFYPMQYAVQQIGGSHVNVSSLTPPGAEPHDLELTPKEVASVAKADLVVYAKGFQSAVDDAVKSNAAKKAFDVAPDADLNLKLDAVTQVGDKSETEDESTGTDPHFWLDPTRYASVAKAIAAKLEQLDPAHKSDYEKNLTTFTGKLAALDSDFTTGLKSCTNKTIVTSHTAFGYLAKHYGLQQVGVMGITPDQEPTPGRLKDVTAYVRDHHVTTIYTETLASPKVAQAVASETGAKVATLDPIEGVTKDSAGTNYLEIMRSNLMTLKTGQGCS